jgi:microcystin degradation protein MlrC
LRRRGVRIFIAGIETETNTFVPWPTGARGFAAETVRGDAVMTSTSTAGQLARLYSRLAAKNSAEVVSGVFAYAEPSGPTVQSVFDSLCSEITEKITQAGPFEMILLLLHGAMVAVHCDDCEGEILARVRAIVGRRTIVGAVLDPHCHLSDRMVANANVLIACKHYPHDDYADRAVELFELCSRASRGEVRPVTAVFDCRMIGGYPTTQEPMASFVASLKAAEHETGMLSVSLIHGFPWGDTHDTGTKVLVIADGDCARAHRCAEILGRKFYGLRERLELQRPGIDSALAEAQSMKGLIVLADTADNPGGGAPGDNTELLRAMIDRGMTRAALGCLWDPMAALVCAEAGADAVLDIRLGGKCGPASGAPLDLRVRVRAIREAHFQTGLGGGKVDLGLAVRVQVGGIDVVVSSIRTQVFHPDAFTGLGIEMSGLKCIAVKSTQHFRTGFDALADHVIYVATPGALNLDFASIVYRKRRNEPYYPRVHDPLDPM